MTFTLDTFHDKWMDGYLFCRRVYRWLEQIKKQPGGLSKLRGRKSTEERKLIQELLPLAQFIRVKYRPGNSIRIKWKNGNQPYDAMIRQTDFLSRSSRYPSDQFIEVTCAEHPNEYLARELSAADIGRSSVEGLYRDKESKTIISVPTVRSGYEHVDSFVEFVSARISEKASKAYPDNTVLIVACDLCTPFVPDEFEYFDRAIKSRNKEHPFLEILVFDSKFELHQSVIPRA